MKRPFNPPTVKHDISVRPRMVPDENGNLVQKGSIINISGPGLPGIHYPYEDVSLPSILQIQNLNDLFAIEREAPVKLWGDYWQSGQLCLLTGDMGVGKSTLAIRLGRAIAEGGEIGRGNEGESEESSLTPCPSPKERGVKNPPSRHGRDTTFLKGDPKKVLFVGFELSAADMKMRYGGGEVSGNFVYANLNADAFGEGRANMGERLVKSLDKMVEETDAQILIIDQPDRMYLQPEMWNYFMLKLNELKVLRGLSILLTLNNKPRNLSKAPTISSMYRSNLLAPHADSIVCIANHCRAEGKRYLKQLKNTSRPLEQNTHPEVVEIGLQNNNIYLQPCGVEREENVLLPTATERRNRRMMEAEEMRRQGMGFREIAERMELPERTVRSWVGFIEEREARSEEGRESEINTPSPLRGTPPTLGGEFTDLEIPSPRVERGLKMRVK